MKKFERGHVWGSEVLSSYKVLNIRKWDILTVGGVLSIKLGNMRKNRGSLFRTNGNTPTPTPTPTPTRGPLDRHFPVKARHSNLYSRLKLDTLTST